MNQRQPTADNERPAQMSAGMGQPGPSRETPVSRHSPPIPCRTRHRGWRIGEMSALFALLTVAGVLAGCASSATTGPSATPTHTSAATASTPAATRIFTSRHYDYAEALPAGWLSGGQATQQWDGTGAPGSEDSVVDLFQGPGGVEAWAIAAPTKENLPAYTSTTIGASNAGHQCPPVTQASQAITIGGAPARLLAFQCPAGSGFLVEIAITVHDGTAFLFASQNPTGTKATDRAAFRKFLAGIRL
jgi:hypothetical protein